MRLSIFDNGSKLQALTASSFVSSTENWSVQSLFYAKMADDAHFVFAGLIAKMYSFLSNTGSSRLRAFGPAPLPTNWIRLFRWLKVSKVFNSRYTFQVSILSTWEWLKHIHKLVVVYCVFVGYGYEFPSVLPFPVVWFCSWRLSIDAKGTYDIGSWQFFIKWLWLCFDNFVSVFIKTS